MKNLRDFFNAWKVCPLCDHKVMELSVYINRTPRYPEINFSINKNYIYITVKHSNNEYNMKINLNTNKVVFGEESFGFLSGGNYFFELECENCHSFSYECITAYNEGYIEYPKLNDQQISIVELNDNGSQVATYKFTVDYGLNRSTLGILKFDYLSDKSKWIFVQTPLITISKELIQDKNKLLAKFKNILLLT